MSCVAIIPARGGSQRIPRKNIKLFHGKPIIAYSILTAIEAGIFDRIIVSTDDNEIASVARQYGAEVMMRSAEMSLDEVGTQEVMAHVLKDIECDYACCIYPCAPMMRAEDLRLAFELMPRHLVLLGTYIVPMATWLRDPGQFYFGKKLGFVNHVPLLGHSQFLTIPENIECDINTEADWLRAEEMYAELHKE